MFKLKCKPKKKNQKKLYYIVLSKYNTPTKYNTHIPLGVFNSKLKLYKFKFKQINVCNKLGYTLSKSYINNFYSYLKNIL